MANTFSAHFVAASSQIFKSASGAGVFEPTIPISIEFWIKPTNNSSRNDVICWTRNDAAAALLITLGVTSGKISMYLQGTSPVNIDSVTSIPTNVWTHIAFTYDGTTAKIYLNGSSTADATSSISHAAIQYVGAHPMSVGGNLGNDDTTITFPFNGDMDELRFWGVVRTGAQINANYRIELVGNETNLVGYYKFNNSAVDSQTNVTTHNLTAVNSPTFTSDVPFPVTTTMSTVVGAFTLTGVNVNLGKLFRLAVSVGNFILTGNSVSFRMRAGWKNLSKSTTSTLANVAKNISSWINPSKS